MTPVAGKQFPDVPVLTFNDNVEVGPFPDMALVLIRVRLNLVATVQSLKLQR